MGQLMSGEALSTHLEKVPWGRWKELRAATLEILRKIFYQLVQTHPVCLNGSGNAAGLFLSYLCVCVCGINHAPQGFFISFANTEEFSHPCLVKWLCHQPSVERALITFKVKHLSALTLSRNGLSGLWNNEVMSFLHTAGKSFGFHTGAAAYTKPALLNAFKATLLPCQRVLPKLRLWNMLTTAPLQCLWGAPGAWIAVLSQSWMGGMWEHRMW